MRFTISAAALLAFASSVLAQTTEGFDAIDKPTKDENVPAGSTYEIVWEPSAKYAGTVTISLIGGTDPAHLVPVDTIKSGVDSSAGTFSWAVAPTLGQDATYGIKIALDSDATVYQYSFPFHITGGAVANSSSSSVSASATGSGTATVTISKASSSTSSSATTVSTSSSAVESSAPVTSSAPLTTFSTAYPTGNLSTSAGAGPTKVTLTTTTTGTGSSSSKTSEPATLPSTGAASQLAAGSVAMLGGLAMAMLAL